MDTTEAQELLNLCDRQELRDHAFGDREVSWRFDGVEVAGGYFGSGHKSVWIHDYEQIVIHGFDHAQFVLANFSDDEAHVLSTCGKVTMIERNDMQGDDIPNYRGA